MLAVELLATLHKLCPCRRRRFDFIAVCHCCIFCTFLYSMIVVRWHYWLLLWSSLCDRFPVACLLRSHVLLNLYDFKCLNTCQDLSLFGLAIRWTMYESDQGQPKPSKTTNQTETVRFLICQQIHRDPQPNPVFAIEKGDRRWKTDHGRPGRLYTSMHHRYVQMRILRGYELFKMKDWDVLNMFEYAWSLHSTCAPMQMTWWCLTYFDITDHNDIDIDYDLTKQGLAQFLSWRRRVFYSIGHLFQCHCMIFAINSLPIFARSCTFLDFLKWRVFQRLQAYCKPKRAAFKLNLCKQRSHATCESDLGLTESFWTWCSLYRFFNHESCFANQFPEDQGASVAARSRKHMHKKSLFLFQNVWTSLNNTMLRSVWARCTTASLNPSRLFGVDLDRWTDWRPTRSNWYVLPTSASLSQQIAAEKGNHKTRMALPEPKSKAARVVLTRLSYVCACKTWQYFLLNATTSRSCKR